MRQNISRCQFSSNDVLGFENFSSAHLAWKKSTSPRQVSLTSQSLHAFWNISDRHGANPVFFVFFFFSLRDLEWSCCTGSIQRTMLGKGASIKIHNNNPSRNSFSPCLYWQGIAFMNYLSVQSSGEFFTNLLCVQPTFRMRKKGT